MHGLRGTASDKRLKVHFQEMRIAGVKAPAMMGGYNVTDAEKIFVIEEYVELWECGAVSTEDAFFMVCQILES